MVTVGSLCTGTGALDMAVPGTLAWVADHDPHVSTILTHHYPDTSNLGDVTTITDPPHVDIVTAGFPCQPVSDAGRKQGTHDHRWIIDDVCRVARLAGARMLVLENVPGLLTADGGHAMAAVCRALAREGYRRWEWGTYDAAAVGAPHRRRRWFCAAFSDAIGSGRPGRPREAGRVPVRRAATAGPGEVPTDPDGSTLGRQTASHAHGVRRQPTARHETDRCLPAGSFGRYESAVRRWERILDRPAPNPRTDRGTLAPRFVEWMMGLPAGWVTDLDLPKTAQLRILGNGVVPQQAAYALADLIHSPVDDGDNHSAE